MPSINLRLTESELAELKAWAQDGRRSIQKEIVWRLFAAEAVGAPKIGPATNEPRREVKEIVSADAQPRDIPSRTVAPEFPGERVRGGPDPKPGQKR